MTWEGIILKIVPIECTVHMQQLHYFSFKPCMYDTTRNFDLLVTKTCICPDNGMRMSEFKFGPHWNYSVYRISHISFDEST